MKTRQIVALLNDTKEGQSKAELAIDQAEHDIRLSESDLTEIFEVTKEARKKAGDTSASVDSLDSRLKQLQTQSVRNDFVLNQEIRVGLEKVAANATLVAGNTERLGTEYKKAGDSLNYRVTKSKGDIQRAKQLLQKASELTTDTSTKLKDLEGMESVYRDNDRLLGDLMAQVDSLTGQMENYLVEIERKSHQYRECTT